MRCILSVYARTVSASSVILSDFLCQIVVYLGRCKHGKEIGFVFGF